VTSQGNLAEPPAPTVLAETTGEGRVFGGLPCSSTGGPPVRP